MLVGVTFCYHDSIIYHARTKMDMTSWLIGWFWQKRATGCLVLVDDGFRSKQGFPKVLFLSTDDSDASDLTTESVKFVPSVDVLADFGKIVSK